jgi:hypothetical protein
MSEEDCKRQAVRARARQWVLDGDESEEIQAPSHFAPPLQWMPRYRGTIIANQVEQSHCRLVREIRQRLESDEQEFNDLPNLVPVDELSNESNGPPELLDYDEAVDELSDESDEPPQLLDYDISFPECQILRNERLSGMICYVDDTFNQIAGNREEGKHEIKQPEQELFIKREEDPEE